MKRLLPILMTLALIACENGSTHNKTLNAVDSLKTSEKAIDDANMPSQETEIIIKNKSDYSEKFIADLGKLGFKKIELIDSLLILDGTDTIYFLTKSKFGKQTVFSGIQDNLAIAITVQCVNYTTIEYRIEMTEFGKASYEQSGQAEIEPSLEFLLESESDDNEQTGEAFFVRAYIDNRENDCTTQIRLGIDGRQAKLYKNCNGVIRDIGADNFKTLQRK